MTDAIGITEAVGMMDMDAELAAEVFLLLQRLHEHEDGFGN